MARSTYSVTRAQSQLPRLVRRAESGALVGIARRDETVAYLLSREYLEAIVETLEILGDPQMVTALRESLEDLKRGRVVSHAEAKKRLGV